MTEFPSMNPHWELFPERPPAAECEALSDGMGFGLIEVPSGRILSMNQRFVKWFRGSSETQSQLTIYELWPECDLQTLAKQAAESAQGFAVITTPPKSAESDVEEYTEQEHVSRLDHNVEVHQMIGRTDQLLVVIKPTTKNIGAISQQGYVDPVTNLPDRRSLETWQAQRRAEANSSPTPYALLFLDLNHFKLVNDRFGHASGDQVLATLAQRWREALRDDDLVVRFGGDEFVVLLDGIRTHEDALPIMNRLLAITCQPLQIGKEELSVSLSIGISLSSETSGDLEEMLSLADRDMYSQKRPNGTLP